MFQPCLPTGGKVVPATPAWFHEIKYDGYRLIVQRDGDRVRLITRGGHDLDQPLPVDHGGRAQGPPEALRARQRDCGARRRRRLRLQRPALRQVQRRGPVVRLRLAGGDDDLRGSRFTCARPTSNACSRAGPRASSSTRLSAARLAPTCFARPAGSASRGWSQSVAIDRIGPAAPRTGSRSKIRKRRQPGVRQRKNGRNLAGASRRRRTPEKHTP
jgi:hypothetical protein